MKVTRHKMLTLILAVTVWVLCVAGAGLTYAQKPDPAPTAPQERVVLSKPERTVLTDKVRADVIVLKFHEGTRIRARSNQLIADEGNRTPADESLLRRANLDRIIVAQELTLVNNMFQNRTELHVVRTFTRPEPELEQEKQEGELNSGEELADLNLYYYILVENAQPLSTGQLIDQLNALEIVEIAYPQPISEPAQIDIPPTTPSFTGNQGYLNAAATNNGIDARYAWNFAGGRGDGVRIVDVEGGWNLAHEDLPGAFYRHGEFSTDPAWRQHGTAVLGVMVGGENSYGVTGIAPRATPGAGSIFRETCFLFICWTTDDVPDAINRAAAQSRAGDLVLIELHRPGPGSGLTCPCNCGQFEYIAVEFWQAEFDAIRNATARGVIVVEAAGNGAMNLDSSIYSNRFNRAVRDSGAILVGAGSSGGRVPACFTNSGSRVDVQGWGDSVMTLGYGGIQIAGGDDRQWYTTGFSGTSSASPIVTGAAAAVQGLRRARGLPVLNSFQMRDLLRRTGTAQAAGRPIGPLPNLRNAFDGHGVAACTSLTPTQSFQFTSGFVAPNGFRDYCFSAVQGQVFEFQTCAPGSADFDTIIDVRDSGGGSILVSSDDACLPGLQSRVVWQAPSTGSFRARARGFSSSTGSYTMAYRYQPAPCTANISPGANFQLINGSISAGGFRDYCFNASAGQRLDFQTCAPGSATFDTIIELLNAGGSSIMAFSDDACGLQSRVASWPVPSTGSYRARVLGFGSSSGSYVLAHRRTPGNVSGTVVRAVGGAPIVGAGVRALQGSTQIASTTTNGAGSYTLSSLPVGTYEIAVSAVGFLPQSRTGVVVSSGLTTSASFSLAAAPGNMAGRVTRLSDGAAISGARVEARQGAVLRGSALTDAAGFYVINNLAAGTYEATASLAGFITQMRSGLVVNPAATTTVNFSLAAAPGSMAGRVTRASDGSPLNGARVEVLQGGVLRGSANTDAARNYLINNLAAGTYDASASLVGYVSQTRSGLVVNPGATTTANFALAAAAGNLAGQVTKASDGTAIDGANIQVTPSGRSTTTDASGNYAISGLTPGSYNLTVSKPAYLAQARGGVVINPGATTTENFGLTPMPVSFASAGNLSAGTNPASISSGDFNFDGLADLAAANYGSGSVVVLLGIGSGSFAPAASYSVTTPRAISWDDFNFDGIADLVTANREANTVSILLGVGDGTFLPAADFPAGALPVALLSADFNSDGYLDIVTADRDANGVSLLPNDPAAPGTFGAASAFAAGPAPNGIVAGDFDANGTYDLAIANRDSGNVSILLGDGAGSFTAGATLTTGSAPVFVLAWDWDGNGTLDLVTANSGSDNLTLLLGDGAGGFAAAGTLPTGLTPYSAAIGDYNADGLWDLAVANFGSNNLSILLGNGVGGFALAGTFAVGTQPISVIGGDFDGDGKADLALANYGSGNLSILLNNTIAP